MSVPVVRVGNVQLNAVAPVGELVLTYRFPGGCWEASWTLGLRPGQVPPDLPRDARATITLGGVELFAGDVDEPDWSDGQMLAMGAVRSAETALCLNNSNNTTTTIPNTAIDQAVARGALTFGRHENISAAAYGDEAESAALNTVTALLDAWAEENNTNWTVPANRGIITRPDPTEPLWHIVPDAAELGVASETLAGRVIGLWQGTTGRLSRTAVGSGRPEVPVDLRPLSAITSTRATAILNSILAKTGPAAGSWANTIEVTREQIMTRGGVHPHLGEVAASVAEGVMVRLLGHPDPRTDDRTYAGRGYTDVIIEEASWNTSEGKLTLTPRGYADRDLASIIESAGGSLAS